MLGEERVEPGPARLVDREDVVEREVEDVAAADDEAGDGRGGHADRPEQCGIRGDLEERGHALAAGELGVADEPARGRALEEVGVAHEGPVEERRLVDHLGVGVQRVDGAGVGSGQGLLGVPAALDLDDLARVLAHQAAQLGLLVLVAELGHPREHRVVDGRDPLGATEQHVETAHESELARGCRAQVAGADDEPRVVAEEEHAPNLTPATDSGTVGHGIRHDSATASAAASRHPPATTRQRAGARGRRLRSSW